MFVAWDVSVSRAVPHSTVIIKICTAGPQWRIY